MTNLSAFGDDPVKQPFSDDPETSYDADGQPFGYKAQDNAEVVIFSDDEEVSDVEAGPMELDFRLGDEERSGVGTTPSAKTKRPAPRVLSPFRLVGFDEITLGIQSPYVVKGLVPKAGLVVVYGAPKCGKSFWAVDLAMHIAQGHPYRGRRVKQGAVVYCAFEGQEGVRARIQAIKEKQLPPDRTDQIPFYLMGRTINFQKEWAALTESIKATLGTVKPVVVVLDTLNRSLVGSESSDVDMGNYIKAADYVREELGCAVVVVHHSGLDRTRPRGHTSLTGAADAQLSVQRDKANNIVVQVEFMKDGPTGDRIVSKLTPVTVGQDQDGDPIVSCIIEAVDDVSDEDERSLVRVPPVAQAALEALRELMDEEGTASPTSDGIPEGVMGVQITAWRARCKEWPINRSTEPRAQQKAFQRAREVLLAAGLTGEHGNYVWLVEDKGGEDAELPALASQDEKADLASMPSAAGS